ncbi:transcriptional regulator Medusa [Ophiocordyceps camponoti-floridani]|uniref:Transcriptional regulator Medusa n=1 Tax=Ophiocordyceps camponoti-floridani TaxID=2030778 RepID=A0A8H4QCX8_9HYPO|nr:transcriptional regulator Medusa [Ophiocordyceps camponoti-floridani]
MSAVKFHSPSYKLFEPEHHTDRPIIVGVDTRLESPDTVTLKYEEAARAASGGDVRGDSPPTVLEMAAYSKAQLPSMHGYDSTRYPDTGYEQYPAPSFSSQQTTDKFAQLNQQSFASNNAAVAQYMPAGPTVLSCHPTSGMFGTKVVVKFSSQYDLFSMSSPMPYFYVYFGSEKCPAHDVAREAQDSSGFVYSCGADAPQAMVTGCSGSNVPLSLAIEGPSGEEMSRTAAGSFHYLEGSGDDITRTARLAKHDASAPGPQGDQPSGSPKAVDGQLATEPATNSYEYPSQPAQYGAEFPQTNGDMISSYRSTSFTDPQYHRRTAPGWSGFGATTLGSTGRASVLDHAGLGSGRPSLTPLPMPSSASPGTPQLIRTSTIANGTGSNGSYHPISLYSSKAVLKINGKLDTMAENWTQEEWDNRRRIVMFRKSQTGSTLTASFRAVPVNERPPNSICISCIWWAEKAECYVTSVDTIHLLEQLVAAPNRFSVEEKNRIRRNLEGFHPLTVSKAKPDSEEFFKVIMGFPNPKPRNIEKDVKVFPWKILEPALKKIIGKYSASPSSTLPPASMMTPVSTAPYAPLPTPPGQSMTSQPGLGSQHGDHYSQHESMPSPRSLSGSQPSWTPYTTAPTYSTAASRTLSPGMRHASPQPHAPPPPPPMRISTTPLPAVSTYDSRAASSAGYGSSGLHTPISHHPTSATPPRWDTASTSYPDSYPSLTSHHGSSGHSVYGTSAYGDGASRA